MTIKFIQMADPQFGMFSAFSKLSEKQKTARRESGMILRFSETKIHDFSNEIRLFTKAIELSNELKPDFVVDITGFLDKKIDSVKAYRSQFYSEDSKEPETPISSSNFLDSITYRAQDMGRLINTEHAEGYNVDRYVAVDSVFDLI